MNADQIHPGLADMVGRLSTEWPTVEITFNPVGALWDVSVVLPQPKARQIGQRTGPVGAAELAKWIERVAANIRHTLAHPQG